MCCDVRYDFRIKTMLGSSLPPVVYWRNHVLFTLFVLLAYINWCPIHIMLCLCFVCRRLVYPMLPVSLDCPFLLAPLVFSNVYLTYMYNLFHAIFILFINHNFFLERVVFLILRLYGSCTTRFTYVNMSIKKSDLVAFIADYSITHNKSRAMVYFVCIFTCNHILKN